MQTNALCDLARALLLWWCMAKRLRPLLDTYEAERLPVMRGVLFKTDKLTTAIGTENPVVRTLFNHLGPFVAGAGLVQENATAGMSQVALNYRNSSLSEEHTHGGALRAGDRVPDMNVRLRSDSRWVQTTLMSALDPSHLTLVVAAPDRTMLPPDLEASVPESRFLEIAADPKDAAPFQAAFGKVGAVVLVRPDGYAGLTTPISAARIMSPPTSESVSVRALRTLAAEERAMLDPATVQILFADLQPSIVARSKTNPPQSLVCAASVLPNAPACSVCPCTTVLCQTAARHRRCCRTSQRKPKVHRNRSHDGRCVP